MRITEPLLCWISNFLTQRKQISKRNSTFSVSSVVRSGISQVPFLVLCCLLHLSMTCQRHYKTVPQDVCLLMTPKCSLRFLPQNPLLIFEKVIDNMHKKSEEWQLHFKYHILSIKHKSLSHDFTYHLGSKYHLQSQCSHRLASCKLSPHHSRNAHTPVHLTCLANTRVWIIYLAPLSYSPQMEN